MRSSLFMIALGSLGLAGCQSVGSNGPPPVTSSTTPAGAATSTVAPAPAGIPAPVIPTGAALGGVLGGPVGASLTDDDRQAAWVAQVAALSALAAEGSVSRETVADAIARYDVEGGHEAAWLR